MGHQFIWQNADKSPDLLAEAIHSMAIAYDWLYPAWTAQERTVLLGAIEQHGLKVGLQAYSNAAYLASLEGQDGARAQAAKSDLAAVNQQLNYSGKPTREAVNSGWWAVSDTNWNLVCNTGLILGALVSKEAFPDEAAKVERLALESLQETGFANSRLHGKGPFAEFSPEGAYAEGPGYSATPAVMLYR